MQGQSKWLLAGCLAFLVSWVSVSLEGRFIHRRETVADQIATLHRAPYTFDGKAQTMPEFRSRVLFPLLLEGGIRLHLGSATQWYVVLRLTTALIAFGTMVLLIPYSPWLVDGMGILAYCLILSFNHAWETPSDFFDVAFTLLFCALTLSGRWWVLLATTLLASLNRESAAFSGIIWAFQYGRTPNGVRKLEIARGLALSVLAYGSTLILRHLLAAPGDIRTQALGIADLPSELMEAVGHPQPFAWPVLLLAMAMPLGWITLRTQSWRDSRENALIGAALCVGLISAVFGRASELRIFLPACVILIYANLHAASRSPQSARWSGYSEKSDLPRRV